MLINILIISVFILIILIIYTIYVISQKSNLVFITSVIHTHPSKLSYGVRSKYTHKQRYIQTIHTIESIKKHVPNSFIVLIEGSHLTESEKAGLKMAGAHKIIYCADELEKYINGPHKSVGEINMLLFAIKQMDLSKFETISKISGRYYLSDNFDWYKYSNTKALFQCETPPSTKCNTRYYRIPEKYYREYIKILENALRDPMVINGTKDIETYNIFTGFQDSEKIIQGQSILGVKGYVAPLGIEVED